MPLVTAQRQILAKKYKDALARLKTEEDKLEAGGSSPAADAAYLEAVKARDAAKAKGIKVEDIPETNTARLAGDGKKSTERLSPKEEIKAELDRADITDNSGLKVIQARYPERVDEKGDATVNQSYLYVDPANPKMRDLRPGSRVGEMGIKWGTTDEVRNLYKKQLIKIYGTTEALYNKLYQAGYIKNKKMSSTTGTRDMLDALELAVADYSLTQINDYENGKIKGDFPTMDAFLSSGNRDSKSLTQTTKTATVYDDTRATGLINNLTQRFKGRNANAQEIKELIPMIQDFLKKNPQITTSTQNEEGTFSSGTNKLAGDPEEFLIEKLSQQDETKARSVLGYYDTFKSVIGVQ